MSVKYIPTKDNSVGMDTRSAYIFEPKCQGHSGKMVLNRFVSLYLSGLLLDLLKKKKLRL